MPTQQAMSELKRANQIRRAMNDLKREAKANGVQWLAHRLEVNDPILARMRVGSTLCSLPHYGPTRAVKVLRIAELPRGSYEWRIGPLYEQWDHKKDRTLTTRQRRCLAVTLEESCVTHRKERHRRRI